jgi:transcriptional regulator with XRE-family HTH domain
MRVTGHGPDARQIRTRTDLGVELDLLRARAAAGTRRARVSLRELADSVDLPRSTLHGYLSGRTMPPADLLDRIVIALGATGVEQREWAAAWYRVQTHEAHGPAPRAQLPCGLPAPIQAFTGRREERSALQALLGDRGRDSRGLAIAAICGPPGVGKSALAVQWAHEARDLFPDGCLYLDLRGYDPEPPMPGAQALAVALRTLEPGIDVPPEMDARLARYRSLLAGRRLLVVLDNAASGGHVRPLLPGDPSCATIVTSRDDLSGLVARDGARRVEVQPLPLTDALALLRSLLGVQRLAAEPTATRLAELCGRLPLALRIAAELARNTPANGLGDLVTQLADRPLDRLAVGDDARTAMRAVISWSYRRLVELDPPAAEAFRLLGRHAADGCTPASLESLARASLIRRSPDGRYRMDPLVRAFARELPPGPAPRGAGPGGVGRHPAGPDFGFTGSALPQPQRQVAAAGAVVGVEADGDR